MSQLANKLEALLFYVAEPLTVGKLVSMCGVSESEIQEALGELHTTLENRGIHLQQHDGMVQLVTAPEFSEIIATLRKEELEKELGKAALETLAIVAYKGEVTRADIDYIRGVNSAFSARALLVRGLIQKKTHPTDQRSFLYSLTLDALSHLGITDREALPDFMTYTEEMEMFMRAERE